jgi:hypothetical protein
MADGQVNRFLGGSLSSTLVKLLFLSLIVGAFMAFLDLTPWGLIESFVDFVRRVFGSGFAAVREVGRWLLFGAVIVVPLWLLSRLLRR